MRVTVETWIAAPPQRVFAVTADIPRWPEVISAIARVDLMTPGPVAAGTRFKETRTMFGREAVEEMTVAELRPPERLVLTAENHGARYRAVHSFAPEGAGTILRLDFEGVPMTVAARLLAPIGWMMKGHVVKQLEADLADLKRAAEAAR